MDIVKRAIESPLRSLAANAGVEGSIIVQEVKRRKGNDGYNVATGEYEDLVKAGVVDPKKVTRTALQNAASIAGLLADHRMPDHRSFRRRKNRLPAAVTARPRRHGRHGLLIRRSINQSSGGTALAVPPFRFPGRGVARRAPEKGSSFDFAFSPVASSLEAMNRWSVLGAVLFALLAFPQRSPAPLIYRDGEGWSYEKVGAVGKWQRTRAKDQLEVAENAFAKKDYSLARKAAGRTVTQWPYSDYAPQAQYLMARIHEAKGDHQKAFKAYQRLLEKYPRIDNYDEILNRQYAIANRYLAGEWFKLWGVIPIPPALDNNMEKTAAMYEKIIKSGPYSDVAPKAQLSIGRAHEKEEAYGQAVKAYERAADRYNDRAQVASDALFNAGVAYNRQAKTAEYDQSVASQAIATFNDFQTLYPDETRVNEAQRRVDNLRTEQARGSYEIARFYEKSKKWDAALIYYNDVTLKDPNSKFAKESRDRIVAIKKKHQK